MHTISGPVIENGSVLVRKARSSPSARVSDDAEDLSNELQMIAGRAAGTEGRQIHVAGLSVGWVPPKQSIRRFASIKIRFRPSTSVSASAAPKYKPGTERYYGQRRVVSQRNFGNGTKGPTEHARESCRWRNGPKRR